MAGAPEDLQVGGDWGARVASDRAAVVGFGEAVDYDGGEGGNGYAVDDVSDDEADSYTAKGEDGGYFSFLM